MVVSFLGCFQSVMLTHGYFTINQYCGRFLLCLTLEESDPLRDKDMPNICAVDFGTENFATIVWRTNRSGCTKASSLIWDPMVPETAGRTHPYLKNKISHDMLSFCIAHQAGTLVLGKNPLWKQNLCIGIQNTQKFVQMPIAYFEISLHIRPPMPRLKSLSRKRAIHPKRISQ